MELTVFYIAATILIIWCFFSLVNSIASVRNVLENQNEELKRLNLHLYNISKDLKNKTD
jgi:hypothetical protein